MVRGIPEAAMDRLMRTAGAERVSDNAKKVLRDHLEGQGSEISRLAKIFAEHAKRNTIKQEDILLAIKSAKDAKRS